MSGGQRLATSPVLAVATAPVLVLALVLGGCGATADLETLEKKIREEFPEVRQLSTGELSEWLEDSTRSRPVLLDVREAEEYAVSHLPGARRVDPDGAGLDLTALPEGTPVVLYCSVGYRSSRLAQELAERGLGEVYNLEGSIFRWANEGRPIVRTGEEGIEEELEALTPGLPTEGEEPADQVHPYNRFWGRYLQEPLRAPTG